MKFFLIATCFLLFCCSSKNESRKDPESVRAKYFRESFLKKFKTLDLPCTVEHNPTSKDIPTVSVDLNSLDTLFFSRARVEYYAMSSDTSNFFTLFMYMYGAMKPLPVIVTFDKSAKMISSKQIDFGCWDGGPYDYTCSGGFVINADLSISLSHETVVTKSYNSDSAAVHPWKDAHTWKGRILKNGVVEIEERPR